MGKIVKLLTSLKARCEKILANKGSQVVVVNPDVVLKTA
jgi:hypothetical protein